MANRSTPARALPGTVSVIATINIIGLHPFAEPVALERTKYIQGLIDQGFLVDVDATPEAAQVIPVEETVPPANRAPNEVAVGAVTPAVEVDSEDK